MLSGLGCNDIVPEGHSYVLTSDAVATFAGDDGEEKTLIFGSTGLSETADGDCVVLFESSQRGVVDPTGYSVRTAWPPIVDVTDERPVAISKDIALWFDHILEAD